MGGDISFRYCLGYVVVCETVTVISNRWAVSSMLPMLRELRCCWLASVRQWSLTGHSLKSCCDVIAGHNHDQLMTAAHSSCRWQAAARFTELGIVAGYRYIDKSHVLSVRDGHSYAKRIVNVWNSLYDCIVLTRSVIAFKREINKLHFSSYCLT